MTHFSTIARFILYERVHNVICAYVLEFFVICPLSSVSKNTVHSASNVTSVFKILFLSLVSVCILIGIASSTTPFLIFCLRFLYRVALCV